MVCEVCNMNKYIKPELEIELIAAMESISANTYEDFESEEGLEEGITTFELLSVLFN